MNFFKNKKFFSFILIGVLLVGSGFFNAKIANAAAVTITSARVIGPTQIEIVFSSSVDWNMDLSEFTNLNIGGSKTISSSSGLESPSDTITITFTGGTVGTDATGTIDIAALGDHGTGNTFAGVTGQVLSDGQAPTPISATFYDAMQDDGKLDLITVIWSEPINEVENGSADWAISSESDWNSDLTESSSYVRCNFGGAGANECDYYFTTDIVKTDVGDLTLAYTAGTSVTDGINTANSITFTSDSTPAFTDGANPIVSAVELSNIGTRNRLSITYSENIIVTDGASTPTKGDLTTWGMVAGFGSFGDQTGDEPDITVPTTKNTVSGSGTNVINIDLADQDEGYIISSSEAEPNGTFTRVASPEVVDVADLQVNPASAITVNVTGDGWDLTKPTLESITVSDAAGPNGRIDRAVLVFSEPVRDSNIHNDNTSLGMAGSSWGTFTTGTADDDTTTFNRTDDNAVDTSTTGMAANFTYGSNKITDLAGNQLDTESDGVIWTDDADEVDGAAPVFVSAVATSDTNIQVTFSEAVTVVNDFNFTSGDFTLMGAAVNSDPTKVDLSVFALNNPSFTSTDLDIAADAVRDVSSATNSNIESNNNVITNGLKPTVVSVSSDGYTFSAAAAPAVQIVFNEDINTMPTVSVSTDGVQTVNNCGDANAKTFCFNYTAPDSITATRTITISDATNDLDNIMVTDSTHTFDVETVAPTGTVSLSRAIINGSNLDQVVTVTYNEPMDPDSTPGFNFIDELHISTVSGSWTDSTHWTQTFTHDGTVETNNDVVVTSSGAKDVAENSETASINGTNNPFDVAIVASSGGGGVVMSNTSSKDKTASVEKTTFPDVGSKNPNYAAVEYLFKKGIINGDGDGKFKPVNKISRAQATKIIVMGSGVNPTLSKYKNCFPDVKEQWYAPYVCYAKEKNWVSGYGDGLFKPEKEISKSEYFKILMNVLEDGASKDVVGNPFADVMKKDWYAGFIEKAKGLGILNDVGSLFLPNDLINRGMSAEYLYRVLILKK